MHYYPFVQVGVDMLIAIMAESNKKIIRLVEKLGYKIEHRLMNAHPDGDLLIYTLTKDNCRFLRGAYAK
jgi:RimJ/RimL family protein N-acetyltransferase